MVQENNDKVLCSREIDAESERENLCKNDCIIHASLTHSRAHRVDSNDLSRQIKSEWMQFTACAIAIAAMLDRFRLRRARRQQTENHSPSSDVIAHVRYLFIYVFEETKTLSATQN